MAPCVGCRSILHHTHTHTHIHYLDGHEYFFSRGYNINIYQCLSFVSLVIDFIPNSEPSHTITCILCYELIIEEFIHSFCFDAINSFRFVQMWDLLLMKSFQHLISRNFGRSNDRNSSIYCYDYIQKLNPCCCFGWAKAICLSMPLYCFLGMLKHIVLLLQESNSSFCWRAWMGLQWSLMLDFFIFLVHMKTCLSFFFLI